jgi:hypothetical protein
VEPKFLSGLNFNDESRREYFKKNNLDGQYPEAVREEMIGNYQAKGFLSKALYYDFVEVKQ